MVFGVCVIVADVGEGVAELASPPVDVVEAFAGGTVGVVDRLA